MQPCKRAGYDKTINLDTSYIIKAAAVILMLVHHLFTFPNRLPEGAYISLFSYNGLTIEQFIGGFGKICVSLFLFLSGYGLYISYFGKTITIKSIIRRILNFYYHYWTVFMIFIPLGIILNKILFDFKEILFNWFGLSSSLNSEWWFVYVYLILTLLFPSIIKLTHHLNGWILFVISLSLVWVSTYIQFYFFQIILNYQIYFTMGILICKNSLFDQININFKNNVEVLKVISWGLLMVSPLFYIILLKLPLLHQYTFVVITPIIVFTIGSLNIKSRIIQFIGKSSTNIWLTHSFFCYYYLQKLTFAPKYSVLILIWLLILSLLTSYIIDILINYITNLNYKFSIKKSILKLWC